MQRVFILSVLGALAGGCVADHGDESFVIRTGLFPDEGAGCTFTTASLGISRGTIDIFSPTSYVLFPLFESRIVAPAGKESLRTIFVQGANVELLVGPTEVITQDGTVTIDDTVETVQFQTLFSAPIEPNGGLTFGSIDLVSPAVLAGIQQKFRANLDARDHVHTQLTATATAFGEYYGDRIDAVPFVFPVTACNDCVIRSVFPDCTAIPADLETAPGNACNPFQDGVVDCCVDPTSGNLLCPAVLDN